MVGKPQVGLRTFDLIRTQMSNRYSASLQLTPCRQSCQESLKPDAHYGP